MLHHSRMHVALQEQIVVSLSTKNIKQMIVEHAFSECRNSSNIMFRSSLLHQHVDIMLTLDGRTRSTHTHVRESICLQKFCRMHVNLQTIQHYLMAGERVVLLDIFKKCSCCHHGHASYVRVLFFLRLMFTNACSCRGSVALALS